MENIAVLIAHKDTLVALTMKETDVAETMKETGVAPTMKKDSCSLKNVRDSRGSIKKRHMWIE